MIGELAALGAAICWVFSSVLYRKALLRISPFKANVIRLTSTSVFLVALLAVVGKIGNLANLPTTIILIASLSGVIGLVLGDILYMYGLKLIGVSRAVPLSCTYPLFTILIALLLKGETVEMPIIIGAISIFTGIWLLSKQANENSNALDHKISARGVISAVSTAIVWSVSITLMNTAVSFPEANSLDGALTVNTIRGLAASLVLLIISPIFSKQLTFLKEVPRKIWLLLFSGGVIALALGWFLLTLSFLCTQETRAVPISSTTPFFSTIAGILFLDEAITVEVISGSVLIVLGIFLLFV